MLELGFRRPRGEVGPGAETVASIPQSVEELVLNLMAKRIERGYQSAGEVRADLERARAGQPVVALKRRDRT